MVRSDKRCLSANMVRLDKQWLSVDMVRSDKRSERMHRPLILARTILYGAFMVHYVWCIVRALSMHHEHGYFHPDSRGKNVFKAV